MELKVILQPGEDNGYVAQVPALRGCWSQGASRQEAIANIREAIAGWLEAEQDKAEYPSAAAQIEVISV